ncbi:tubulin beta chain 4 [Perilla frutescens var. frutescens]|nr:tubulin beta chain 4 [Perilla frutescens var. frutescens]
MLPVGHGSRMITHVDVTQKSEVAELIDFVLDVVRNEVENSDCLQVVLLVIVGEVISAATNFMQSTISDGRQPDLPPPIAVEVSAAPLPSPTAADFRIQQSARTTNTRWRSATPLLKP